MNRKDIAVLALGVFATILSTGCYHSLEIVNERKLAVKPIVDTNHPKLKVALVCPPPVIDPQSVRSDRAAYQKALSVKFAKDQTPCEKTFLQQLAQSLTRQAGYVAYVTDDERALQNADVTIRVYEKVLGDAKGRNLLVGLPGCMLFAYAWYGWAYDVNWKLQADLVLPASGMPLGDVLMERTFDVRYATCGGSNEDPLGNTFMSTMWFIPPLGTVFAIINAGVNASVYHPFVTPAIRDSGKLQLLVDGFAQAIIHEINAKDGALEEEKAKAKKAAETKKREVSPLVSDRLKDLEDLRKAGVLEEDEYQAELQKLREAGE